MVAAGTAMRTVMLVTATLTSAKLTVTAEASTPVAVANSSRQVCLRDEMPELCPSHFFLLLKGSHVVHTYVSVITSVSVEGGGVAVGWHWRRRRGRRPGRQRQGGRRKRRRSPPPGVLLCICPAKLAVRRMPGVLLLQKTIA